jgi:hypothetical protein
LIGTRNESRNYGYCEYVPGLDRIGQIENAQNYEQQPSKQR